MKDEIEQLPTRESSKLMFELGQLGLALALLVGVPYGGWHVYEQGAARETREWFAKCAAIDDPWLRFTKLQLEARPSLTDEQRAEANRQSSASLEAAFARGSSAAFDYAALYQGSYAQLLDKYPRDPVARQAQVKALWIVWPDIASMAAEDRLALVNMAARCHLHEAQEPVDSGTVLSCVRYGAQSLHDEKTLTRLLDSALLFRPLTAAP
jgi:hypothetical protein